MFRKPAFAVISVSMILILYCVTLNIDGLLTISYFVFCISPLLLIWLAYTILRFGRYEGKDLGKKEWGYQDKNKDELWVL